ncbi:winged helix-turn-helix domain-containing protein [Marisediminicola senii]|uniref:winged helix-turn-helix domain-containing protein n=1 Tax=Marisediminicola senii TaxID=2711233 RepID=UPI0013EA921C|nr:crosslink repair DNA glycosylase YcaQ family protein [Marisediminicola senii]
MVESLSPAQARRVALAAQGFGRPQPAQPGTRQLNGVIDRLGLLQLDSVNVFERSHYLPPFARLGPYDKGALDALTFAARGRYVEYWAHEAAVIPVEHWPLFRWRMDAMRAKYSAIEGGWVMANQPMLDWLRAELAEKGPMPASAVEHDSNRRSGPWWGWSGVKEGLEWLFRFGEVTSAGRTRFERNYGLVDTILPAHVVESRIDQADAVRQLMSLSARAHGVGTLSDLADYYRLKQGPAAVAVHDLVDSGELLPVTVPGWKGTAYLHRDARIPRRMDAAALLSPFDPIVWRRERAERMFDFHYRIEIYTPAHKRIFGYYSLPVLLGDTVVGRVDLKNDRQARVLLVQSAWSEDAAPADTAERVAALLLDAARWQGLDRVEVVGRGSLSRGLARVLAGVTP